MAVAKVLAGREYKNYTLGVSKQGVSEARGVLDSDDGEPIIVNKPRASCLAG